MALKRIGYFRESFLLVQDISLGLEILEAAVTRIIIHLQHTGYLNIATRSAVLNRFSTIRSTPFEYLLMILRSNRPT